MNNMEFMMPVTDKMILENLIDEKNREIARLMAINEKSLKPITDEQWGATFLQCQSIDETYDLMVKMGFVVPNKERGE